MAKKKRKSFQQEQNRKGEMRTTETGQVVAFKDELDRGNRIGFCLMGYLLFVAGSISSLVLGFSGAEKSGSGEVKLIGVVTFIAHLLFFSLIVTDVSIVGIMPVKITFILLLIYPLLCLIAGLLQRSIYRTTLLTLVAVMVIPHYAAIYLINPSVLWDKGRENEILVKANAIIIDNAIIKYYLKTELYPTGLDELVNNSFLKQIPINPFTGQPTQNVNFKSAEKTGEVSYLPVEFDGSIRAYYLLVYGRDTTPGVDVNRDNIPDHVISQYEGMMSMYKLNQAEYKKLLREKPPLSTLLK